MGTQLVGGNCYGERHVRGLCRLLWARWAVVRRTPAGGRQRPTGQRAPYLDGAHAQDGQTVKALIDRGMQQRDAVAMVANRAERASRRWSRRRQSASSS